MDRRQLLGTLGTAIALGAAGCIGDDTTTTPSGPDPAAADSVRTDRSRVASLRDTDLPLSRDKLQRGAPRDAIPAITEPVFGSDWSDVAHTLEDDERVVGVTAGGQARAYPLAVLDLHEIVNDTFGGPLLVSFCPLCGSGVVARRLVNGEPTVFGVSGLLWNSDLVLYDRATDSLWSQLLAKAVRGPKTGTNLALRFSTLSTWGEWQAAHPDTAVLLPPPESSTVRPDARSRNYDREPYPGYGDSDRVGIGYNEETDDRLHPKTRVIGVATDETARAYPLSAVRAAGVVNDRVGEVPVVVAATASGTLVAYDRRVDGELLRFERRDGYLLGGGSRWEMVSGRAVDGPSAGQTLRRANDRSRLFWFAWADFYPGTEIYRADG